VIDQVDLFEEDDFTRQGGLTIADVFSQVFYDNVVQSWALIDGAAIADHLVKAGSLYFHEISGSVGNYSLRFRPNARGYWRISLAYVAGSQILGLNYDVTLDPLTVSGGLTASFTSG
jgi:hypothetical protein